MSSADKIPDKILVIRNDKIGDFMLAWPAFALLKRQYPDCEISALVPAYTAELAEQCEWIDNIIIDETKPSFIADVIALSKKIKPHRFEVSISLFSQSRTSLALLMAGVKKRIGPATKIAQLFLNDRLRQKRSQSAKPEFEYNLDLVRYFIQGNGDTVVTLPEPPFLKFDNTEIAELRHDFKTAHAIDTKTKLVFVHPGTGGSAINLSLQQYAELMIALAEQNNVYFVITAGPGETEIAEKLSALVSKCRHHVHGSTGGIIEFCKLINICDLFISGSTGPLHIAGSLDMNTAAFYPARQSATPLRWQTLNRESNRVAFSPESYTGENDMQRIDITSAAELIEKTFLSTAA
jgi:ADP-heptose:LPS heptosyltransferase